MASKGPLELSSSRLSFISLWTYKLDTYIEHLDSLIIRPRHKQSAITGEVNGGYTGTMTSDNMIRIVVHAAVTP